MKKIFEDNRKFIVKEKTDLPFSVSQAGLYLIALSARARNARLISKDATDDEDLTAELDNRSFPHLTVKGRKIDSPAAFSGGTQKGRRKTVYFLVSLNKGDHEIKLTSDNQPKFEGLEVFLLENNKRVELPLRTQAEDGDRYSWLTFALVDFPLRGFWAEVTVWKRYRDSDDAKIKINGELKPFPEPVPRENFLWKLFHWVGNVFLGVSKISFFNTNLPKGTHYIEFIADRKPRLEKVELDLRGPEAVTEPVKRYRYKGVNGDENYNRFDEEIFQVVDRWNNEFLSQEFPPPDLLDPNIVKAMIYVESRMGYFETKENRYSAYPDVMQVADPRNPALKTLQGELTEYEWFKGEITPLKDILEEAPKVEEPEDSINWGVRWLYHKAQIISESKKKRLWKDWKEAVADYNKNDNWEYQKKVWKIYKQGIAPGGVKLWSIILLLLLGLSFWPASWFYFNQGNTYVTIQEHETKRGREDFTIFVNRVDGLQIRRFPIHMNFWAGSGREGILTHEKPIWVTAIKPDEEESQEYIFLSGRTPLDIDEGVIILEYNEGRFRRVPIIDEYGIKENFLSADRILVEKVDRTIRVVEQNVVPYLDAPDQMWEHFYWLIEDDEKYFAHLGTKKIDLSFEAR